MADIVEELRGCAADKAHRAADEIEKLRALLRRALDCYDVPSDLGKVLLEHSMVCPADGDGDGECDCGHDDLVNDIDRALAATAAKEEPK